MKPEKLLTNIIILMLCANSLKAQEDTLAMVTNNINENVAAPVKADFTSYSKLEDTYIATPVLQMSKGEQQAILVKINNKDTEQVTKRWKKAMNPKGLKDAFNQSPKVDKDRAEYHVTGVVIEEISGDTLEIYSTIYNEEDKTVITTFFERNGVFLSENNALPEFKAAQAYVREFAIDSYKNAIKEDIKNQDKIVSDLKGQLKKLDKDNLKNEKSIAKNTSEISTIESEIKINLADQSRFEEPISNQKGVLLATTDDEAKKVEKAKLKELESDKKKLQKENKKMHSKIAKLKNEIDRYKNNISQNEASKELINSEISNYKQIKLQIEKKLRDMK